MAIPNLLFVDTNIWLDFYRARNDTGLLLLQHIEALADRLIVTYQLESEYKRNRQIAIVEGMQELKAPPQQISRPGIFSDAAATRMMAKNLKGAEKQAKKLRERMVKALSNPAAHDPVYRCCQRLFHKTDDLTLARDNTLKRGIRRRAFRRFLHGDPPRKRNDTSIGDAFNWEWMIHCATEKKAGLVIVSRDSDYGATMDKVSYINDHLRQEFSDRVSRKRDLLLYSRLSDALKFFNVKVTEQEVASEAEVVYRTRFLANNFADVFGAQPAYLATVASPPLGTGIGNLVKMSSFLGWRGGFDANPSDPTADEILDNLPKVEPPKESK